MSSPGEMLWVAWRGSALERVPAVALVNQLIDYFEINVGVMHLEDVARSFAFTEPWMEFLSDALKWHRLRLTSPR